METPTYENMVLGLQKPGAQILAELTPAEANLVHMALGLASEVGELLTADSYDNFIEEGGDMLFFGTAIRLHYGISEPVLRCKFDKTGPEALFEFARLSCKIADMVKKMCIYRRGWDDTKQLALADLFTDWYDALATLVGRTWHLPQAETLFALKHHNYRKLQGGDKARYAAGAYSDQAAQQRADKDGKED